jgi:hypothetical protein
MQAQILSDPSTLDARIWKVGEVIIHPDGDPKKPVDMFPQKL